MSSFGSNQIKIGKSPRYRVVETDKVNENPPPQHFLIYQLEHIQSGKKLETEYTNLVDAEEECKRKNELDMSPD
jgi:hypothetical protein